MKVILDTESDTNIHPCVGRERAVRQKSGSSYLWSAVMLFMIAAGGSDPNQVATWPNGRVYDQARTHVIDDGSSTRGSTTIA